MKSVVPLPEVPIQLAVTPPLSDLMAPPTMRPATAADAAVIATLLGHLGYPTEAHDIPARLDALNQCANAVLLAIEAEKHPVGLVAVHMLPSLHADAPVAMIMALVVAPEGRGRGIGRELVNAAKEWAVERGCERLMVTSAEHRSDAHAFYPACGMPYTGRRSAITFDPVPSCDEPARSALSWQGPSSA